MSGLSASVTLDDIDRRLLDELQLHVPIDHRPFQTLGEKFGLSEQSCLERLDRLKNARVIRRLCAIVDSRTLGYQVTELAMQVEPGRLDEAAASLSRHAGIAHVDAVRHAFNLWAIVTVPPAESLERGVEALHHLARAEETIVLPTLRLYKDAVKHGSADVGPWPDRPEAVYEEPPRALPAPALSEQDHRFLRIAQEDLPLMELPFAVWAEQAESTEEELFAWVKRAEQAGYLTRIAARLAPAEHPGLTTSMIVWQIPAPEVDRVGEEASRFREVVRCYRRPAFPNWPYTLFTVIRASTPAACLETAKRIEERVGRAPYLLLEAATEHKRARLSLPSSI